MYNICLVAGARPNFIKLAPLIRAVRKTEEGRASALACQLVFTGRADDPSLEDSLFSDLDIPRPDICLGVDCDNLNELTGQVMSQFEKYLLARPADAVVVVDDLASTMAVSIVTKKQGLLLAHIAAGTRSFDITMPKEINRLVIDGLSDLLFTAGMSNNNIVHREGGELSKVYMTGNILMDNLRYCHDRISRSQVLDRLRLAEKDYLLFTLNRKALIHRPENLRRMLQALVDNAGGVPVIAPLRDEALRVVSSFGLPETALRIIGPQGFIDFSALLRQARGVITDSGNVAEEATFSMVPCITLNSYTEHIETVKVGSNVLVGEDADTLGTETARMAGGDWKASALPDRWDGRSAERILQILFDRLSAR